MSDGENKSIITEIGSIKDILVDFRGYSRKKFDKIDNHLEKLNNKVASHETEIAGKADNSEIKDLTIAVEKNKVNKVFWFLFTGSISIVSVLGTYLVTRGG